MKSNTALIFIMIYVESCTKTENSKLAICKWNVKFCLSYD